MCQCGASSVVEVARVFIRKSLCWWMDACPSLLFFRLLGFDKVEMLLVCCCCCCCCCFLIILYCRLAENATATPKTAVKQEAPRTSKPAPPPPATPSTPSSNKTNVTNVPKTPSTPYNAYSPGFNAAYSPVLVPSSIPPPSLNTTYSPSPITHEINHSFPASMPPSKPKNANAIGNGNGIDGPSSSSSASLRFDSPEIIAMQADLTS